MKIIGRSFALGIASAALVTGSFAAPAAADESEIGTYGAVTFHTRGDGTEPPAELGDPKEWGKATLRLDSSAGNVAPQTISEVGGGTWSYGWYATTGGKYCYSNYYHYSVHHGSTAKISRGSVKDTAPPNQTSNASLTAGMACTCSTYWAKY